MTVLKKETARGSAGHAPGARELAAGSETAGASDAAAARAAHREASGAQPATGHVSEMFCSVQGEGPFVGQRQIFLRTAGCSETCSWCDTVYSKVQTPRFVIHDDGKRVLANPLGADTVVDEVTAFAARRGAVDTVSITGGEPLEQPAFVAALARGLHAAGLRVYLETAGMHADAFAHVLPYVHVVAMDIKLPSAIGREAWAEHGAFLDAIRDTHLHPDAPAGGTLFVKIVVDPRGTLEEIDRAVQLVAGVSRRITVVLQPESGTLLSHRTPREDAARLLALVEEAQRSAMNTLADVRVMPQCHRILGIR